MASSFVVKRLGVTNLLTRSISMFPRTVSRSFSRDHRLVGYVYLSYDGCAEVSPDKEERKLCLNVGIKGEEKLVVDDEVKNARYYNFVDMIKKKEFSYRDEELIATLKDGVCEPSFPQFTDKGTVNKFEIKLI